jgi:hypothetical protein
MNVIKKVMKTQKIKVGNKTVKVILKRDGMPVGKMFPINTLGQFNDLRILSSNKN